MDKESWVIVGIDEKPAIVEMDTGRLVGEIYSKTDAEFIAGKLGIKVYGRKEG